ncbi:MAG: PAS domain-containing protein, partial [Chloroflexota bacterium]
MNTSSPLSSLSLRRRPKPGLSAFESLLDLLPAATLLVDTGSLRILLANSMAAQLTGFTRGELNNHSLGALFPTLEKGWLNANPRRWNLALTPPNRRNRQVIDVQVTASLLDTKGEFALFSIETVSERESRDAEQLRQQQVWEALHTLALAPQQADIDSTLKQALQAGSALLGAPLLAIFQAEVSHLVLDCSAICGPAEMLPDRLPSSELVILQKPHLWKRGKRTLSSLHRAARASNLAYLASAPLGEPNALIGLLVAAGEQVSPDENTLPVVEFLAEAITSILQENILITNLRQSLQDYRRETMITSAVRDASLEGVITIAPDLTIRDLNPSAEAILGYASREVHNQPYQKILIGADNIIPPFLTEQPGVNIHNSGNVRLYRRDGSAFLAHVRTLPIMDEDRLESLVVLIQDLSQEEQYRLQNQQLEQRAILGEVTAIFAHEVRNPINNLSTGLQLMALNFPPGDSNQEVVTRMQQDCDRLAELMKSVLSFVRPVEYKMESVDLDKTLRRLMERWRPHLAKVNIKHMFQVESGAPQIEGDPRALEQVWNNLINNAIQAMSKDGGTLAIKIRTITTTDHTPRVEVSI